MSSDYDLPSVYTESRRISIKPHVCCECFQEIPKNALYYHVKGCWEGKWAEFKTCSDCETQRKDYYSEVGELPPFGLLREWCFESDIEFWAEVSKG